MGRILTRQFTDRQVCALMSECLVFQRPSCSRFQTRPPWRKWSRPFPGSASVLSTASRRQGTYLPGVYCFRIKGTDHGSWDPRAGHDGCERSSGRAAQIELYCGRNWKWISRGRIQLTWWKGVVVNLCHNSIKGEQKCLCSCLTCAVDVSEVGLKANCWETCLGSWSNQILETIK